MNNYIEQLVNEDVEQVDEAVFDKSEEATIKLQSSKWQKKWLLGLLINHGTT